MYIQNFLQSFCIASKLCLPVYVMAANAVTLNEKSDIAVFSSADNQSSCFRKKNQTETWLWCAGKTYYLNLLWSIKLLFSLCHMHMFYPHDVTQKTKEGTWCPMQERLLSLISSRSADDEIMIPYIWQTDTHNSQHELIAITTGCPFGTSGFVLTELLIQQHSKA